MKFRELVARLESDGWQLSRQRGSHRVYRHPYKNGIVVLAGKPGKEVPRGTLAAILKQARIRL